MKKRKGNPQLENGYTQIANELLEALMKVNFNSYENRFIRCIIRYTYGFHRKSHKLSLSFIAKATGIALSHISRTKTILLAKKVVTQSGKNRKVGFNKEYTQWVTQSGKLPGRVIKLTRRGNKKLPGRVDKKDNIKNNIKYNIHALKKKVRVKTYKRLPLKKQTIIHRLCYHLEDLLKTKIVNWGKQGRAIKQMMRAGYTEEQIKKTITYMAKKDEFFADKGFDLMTVASQISRYKSESKRR